jgi:RNA polymerase sigma factor for flagellar operon FliA
MHIGLAQYQHLLGELRGLVLGSLQADSTNGPSGEEVWHYRAEAEEEDPYRMCLRSGMLDLLGRAIGELSERGRRVLALYHFEELTMKEGWRRDGHRRIARIANTYRGAAAIARPHPRIAGRSSGGGVSISGGSTLELSDEPVFGG